MKLTSRERDKIVLYFQHGLSDALEGRGPFEFTSADFQGPRPSEDAATAYCLGYKLGEEIAKRESPVPTGS